MQEESVDALMKQWNFFEDFRECNSLDKIMTQNREMVELKRFMEKTAKYSCAVLIQGEEGTGKALCAEAIHHASMRSQQPFVTLHCGAMSETLLGSELFGHVPGSFAGAMEGEQAGKLERAAGGTLFLDEVDKLPLYLQMKLLRALEDNTTRRTGGSKETSMNIRIISSTRLDLQKEAEAGNFSQDLYFRLNTIQIDLPSLRNRIDDLSLLVETFISDYERKFDREDLVYNQGFLKVLSYYCWPGNLQELRAVIERAISLLGSENVLEEKHLPKKIRCAFEYKSLKEKMQGQVATVSKNGGNLLKVGEELIIEMVLKEEKGNLKKVAKRLGISRPTLYKKIHESHKLTEYKESLQEGREDQPRRE